MATRGRLFLSPLMNSSHLFFHPFLLFPFFGRLAFLLLPLPLLLLLCSLHLSLKKVFNVWTDWI